ncbi:MAG TPA: hypothetical protein H9735_02225 [Candidatus Anaerostipes excrementavium]|uniref:Uncharacterized protein n=1 Tax=Candidatus Anaerostipes excrementavium TaxID=2838463 RepID=A0A9D2B972_9FIRM|nr:hypothetical protein [uncultured Anaerostipes sp.]HIX66927.1 hypothetical protein [Candidatus Anaerostipes excrementavium]
MNRKEKRINREIINPGKTEKLQKDWQGYGKAYAYYGLVVLGIAAVSAIYYIFLK